ncbi:MAG TPA: UDP-N-acetylglucosamine 2-epimerase [Candidatus Sulfotelmatobacter sp.]|jgi:UDP-hydrolysing UDP-N-acetyl-D-glucosamine 2-epimerase
MTLRVAVVTVGRSDYGIYFPVLRLLQADPQFELQLIVAAAHFDPTQGSTVQEMENDGFAIAARVPMRLPGDSRQDAAVAIGAGVQEFATAYGELRSDIILLLGDRYEMLSAAVAALPCRIPIGHIHGGELTFGAIDDAIRHCITKLSHVHFAATAEYARRIEQLGEESWRVHTTGSPVIDSILSMEAIPREELEAEIGLDLSQTLLITYHPVTLEQNPAEHISALLAAVSAPGYSLLFTHSNADPHRSEIVASIEKFVAKTPNARLVKNLGHRTYHSVQRHVAAMVGNSSSGIIEAASFRLPVVNIGIRQEGRVRSANVIDVGNSPEEIARGIEKAVSSEFRKSLANMQNLYGDGCAAERIVSVLKKTEIGPKLLIKKFADHRVE